MHGLTFYPPLGQDTRLSVLPHLDVAELKFTTSFESTDAFDEFNRDSARVELWTDARKDGQWVGIPFQDFNSGGALAFPPLDNDKRNTLQLHAIVSVPLSGRGPSGFSYTFRLVYPSGQIVWLGGYGRDGSITLERGDSRISLLGDEWSTSNGGSSHLWKSRMKVDDIDVAHLSREWQWNLCVVGRDSLPKLRPVGDIPLEFSVACLVPSSSLQGVVLPHPIVLSTSQECSASLTSSGIRLSGKGSLLVQTYNVNLGSDRLLDAIFLQSSSPSRVMTCASAPGQLILASPKYMNPVSVVIVPLTPTVTPSSVSILQETLSNLMSSTTSTLYSPSSGDAIFVNSNQKSISLIIPASGVEFFLSPYYTLSGDVDQIWDISFVTPYSLPSSNNLPTPPPSPLFSPLQLARQRHRTTTQSAISDRRALPITRLVLYVLVGLIYYILNAIWIRMIGGGKTSTKQASDKDRVPRRELRVSALAHKKESPTIFVDIEGGMVSILMRCIGGITHQQVDQIKIELDGKRVLPKVTRLTNERAMILAVYGHGSRLKISLIE